MTASQARLFQKLMLALCGGASRSRISGFSGATVRVCDLAAVYFEVRRTGQTRDILTHELSDVSIDLGSALPYLEDRFLRLIRRGSDDRAARELFQKLTRHAQQVAMTVQIIGMDRPVAVADIYQAANLTDTRGGKHLPAEYLIKNLQDAIVLGPPGAGKTVLLHHVFAKASASKDLVPILLSLRRSGATKDLTSLVKHLVRGEEPQKRQQRLLLLVDGYDEVSVQNRQTVASALSDFQSCKLGSVVVTCRMHYSTDAIRAPHFHIAPFTPNQSAAFVEAFAKAYGVEITAADLLQELEAHGFAKFADNPLMLTLVCILKAGPMPALPRTAVGLIQRAIDTLTFRWDEGRGIYRESRLPLDGYHRISLLKRLAFNLEDRSGPRVLVERITSDFLHRQHHDSVPVAQLLTEIAQWYGMFVPAANDEWAFAHKTIQDFLAAQYWVETGGFATASAHAWNTRTAYAACLLQDATHTLVRALNGGCDLGALPNVFITNPGSNRFLLRQHYLSISLRGVVFTLVVPCMSCDARAMIFLMP